MPQCRSKHVPRSTTRAANTAAYSAGTWSRFPGGKRLSHRPLLIIDADREIFLSTGSTLTWPGGPAQPWVVDEITNGGTRVKLYRDKGTAPPPGERLAPFPGERVAFTTLTPPSSYRVQLADDPPWTHVPATEVEPASLEEVA